MSACGKFAVGRIRRNYYRAGEEQMTTKQKTSAVRRTPAPGAGLLGLCLGLGLGLGAGCQPMDPAGGGDGGTGEADGAGGATDGGATDGAVPAERFSFFVTSLESMRELSGSQNGFGGDLRFGEATGLAGADKICRTIAEKSMPGAGRKTWRAFLSTSAGGEGGGPVHAIERIGAGPWYDRLGRLVSSDIQGLTAGPRPAADALIKHDLPNELGVPNKQGVDNHDTLTGSSRTGRYPGGSMGTTCNDWTSAVGATGRPMCGHSWPRNVADPSRGGQWIADHQVPGCAAGVNLVQNGGGMGSNTVGGGVGYGGIYCFALTP
jgi:hypothetical protein